MTLETSLIDLFFEDGRLHLGNNAIKTRYAIGAFNENFLF
jgi:hypothetical protein